MYTVFAGAFYQNAQIIVSGAFTKMHRFISALVNTPVKVSALNSFYQNAPVIVSVFTKMDRL